ncbi:MAG TPA: hypothetical protein DDY14_09485 [Chromatiaceae bacterium]|nr:hypothetical protein [Chromatiaceae bacterium]
MEDAQLQLQEHIKRSDCLYLFFDASLHRGPDQDDLSAGRHQGQGEAIQRAYQAFTESRPGWPIVIVVTKADLLYAGNSSSEIKEEIEQLNNRSAEAIKQGKEVFRDFLYRQNAGTLADVLLASRRRSCVRVCYVAALGAAPKQKSGPEGEPAFVINRFADWMPLGVAETLETGMYAAIRMQQQQEVKVAALKAAPYALGVVLLAIIVLVGIDRDRRTIDAVKEQAAAYDQQAGSVQATTVLEQARQALSIGHPFAFLADRPIPFGNFPDLVEARQAWLIERRFTLQTLENRLENLQAETADLFTLLRRQSDFSVMMDKLAERDREWQDLATRIQSTRERFEQLPEGAGDVMRLLVDYGPARAEFLVQAIDAIWRLAKTQGIPEALATKQVESYLTVLKALQVAGIGVDRTQLAAGLAADDRGRCDLLFDQYQRIAKQNPDQRDAQFESLAQACLICTEETLRPEFCADLTKAGDRWDFEEANKLYQDLSRLDGPASVTPELVQSVETYLKHARERQVEVSNHSPVYWDRAEQFMYWHQQLSRTYRLDGIKVSIKDAEPFIRIDRRPYDCGSSYNPETCYYKNSVKPSGTLTLIIGGQIMANSSYSGFLPRLAVDSLWWEPGNPVELHISNETSGQSTTLANSSVHALLNVATSGLSNATASARLKGLELPPLPFDPKDLTPPDPPSAGRQ